MRGAVGGGRRGGRHPRRDRRLPVPRPTPAWVADHAWHSRREATTVAKTARLLRRPDLGPAADAVLSGDVDPVTATVVAAEYDKLAPDLRDDARPVVLEQFLSVGAECGPAGVRRLRQEILARYGEDDEFEHHQEKCRRLIDLSAGSGNLGRGVGLPTHHRQRGPRRPRGRDRAAVRAPPRPRHRRPRPPTGRAAPRRRVDRGPAPLRHRRAARADLPQGRAHAHHEPTTDLADTGSTRGAVVGTRAAGTLLAPDTIRQIACDAAVIPVILGARRGDPRPGTRTATVHHRPRSAPCGSATNTAPSTAATPPPPGATPTTSSTGSTAAPPTSTTPPSCVHTTTRSSTGTNSPESITPQGVVWDRRPNSYHPTRQ